METAAAAWREDAARGYGSAATSLPGTDTPAGAGVAAGWDIPGTPSRGEGAGLGQSPPVLL